MSSVDKNKIFFGLVNYCLTEQPNIDWVLKTSVIKYVGIDTTLADVTYNNANILEDVIEYVNNVKPYHVKNMNPIEKFNSEREEVNVSIEEQCIQKINVRYDALTPDVDQELIDEFNSGEQPSREWLYTHMANRLYYSKTKDLKKIRELMNVSFKDQENDGQSFNFEKFGYDSYLYDTKRYETPSVTAEYCFVNKSEAFVDRANNVILVAPRFFVSINTRLLKIPSEHNITKANAEILLVDTIKQTSTPIENYSLTNNILDIYFELQAYEQVVIKEIVNGVLTQAFIFQAHPFVENNNPLIKRQFIDIVRDTTIDIPFNDFVYTKIVANTCRYDSDITPFVNYKRDDNILHIIDPIVDQIVTVTVYDYRELYDRVYKWEDDWGISNNSIPVYEAGIDGQGFLRPLNEQDRPTEMLEILPQSSAIIYKKPMYKTFNASFNNYDSIYTAKKGDRYYVDVDGTIDNMEWKKGDILEALIDNPKYNIDVKKVSSTKVINELDYIDFKETITSKNFSDADSIKIIGFDFDDGYGLRGFKLGDKTIHLSSIKGLKKPIPNIDGSIEPGRVLINSEIIEYYEIDEENKTLNKIRRSINGTYLKEIHDIGSKVLPINNEDLKDKTSKQASITYTVDSETNIEYKLPIVDFKYNNIYVNKKLILTVQDDFTPEDNYFTAGILPINVKSNIFNPPGNIIIDIPQSLNIFNHNDKLKITSNGFETFVNFTNIEYTPLKIKQLIDSSKPIGSKFNTYIDNDRLMIVSYMGNPIALENVSGYPIQKLLHYVDMCTNNSPIVYMNGYNGLLINDYEVIFGIDGTGRYTINELYDNPVNGNINDIVNSINYTAGDIIYAEIIDNKIVLYPLKGSITIINRTNPDEPLDNLSIIGCDSKINVPSNVDDNFVYHGINPNKMGYVEVGNEIIKYNNIEYMPDYTVVFTGFNCSENHYVDEVIKSSLPYALTYGSEKGDYIYGYKFASKSAIDWQKNTKYNVDDVVEYLNKYYLCLLNHTSKYTFSILEPQPETFKATKMYHQGNKVRYNNLYYVCNINEFIGEFDNTKWALYTLKNVWKEIDKQPKDWNSNTEYRCEDYIKHNNQYYKCLVNHTSDNNFKIAEGKPDEFSTDIEYKFGDKVKYNRKYYICNTETFKGMFDMEKWLSYHLLTYWEKIDNTIDKIILTNRPKIGEEITITVQ